MHKWTNRFFKHAADKPSYAATDNCQFPLYLLEEEFLVSVVEFVFLISIINICNLSILEKPTLNQTNLLFRILSENHYLVFISHIETQVRAKSSKSLRQLVSEPTSVSGGAFLSYPTQTITVTFLHHTNTTTSTHKPSLFQKQLLSSTISRSIHHHPLNSSKKKIHLPKTIPNNTPQSTIQKKK